MRCRHCNATLKNIFLDLGFAPLSNAYLTDNDLAKPERFYPLKVQVCDQCWLVQTEDYAAREELFSADYAYFSSTSRGWLAHAKRYAENIIRDLSLDKKSMVIEVASNDGYLLKNFVGAGIPCLGIEPTDSTAEAAEQLGIPVIREFFGINLARTLAADGLQADLIVGNNVYAHVPNINDFTLGLKEALKPSGTITLEFPHLMRLIENIQFDTVYHEHFSYLSLYTVSRIFEKAGLRVWKVEELTTHGGSIRVFGCHETDSRRTEDSVAAILEDEKNQGLRRLNTYLSFQLKADKLKNDLLTFLLEQKRKGKNVVAYGAAAKGNTLLNYAGVRPDLLRFVCDAASSKQNKYMPGSHIPIRDPSFLANREIDFLLILPWNIADEVIQQNAFVQKGGCKFVTAVPKLKVW